METLKTSLGNLGQSVATATTGSTKLVLDVVTLASKTSEQGVALSGKTIDAGFAIGQGAVGAVKDVTVATTQATGKLGTAAITSAADIGVATTAATTKLATTAVTETAAVGATTLEGASKTLQVGTTTVFNLSDRTLKGVDTLSRIAASSGANVAARIETSQAATATGIAAAAPEKTRNELLRVFDTEVMRSMKDLLKVASATQRANLQYQVDVFLSVNCYGTSGFFKRYFTSHPCPKQRPANTTANDLMAIKTFTQQTLMQLDALGKQIRVEFGSASGDLPTVYGTIVEKFRAGAATLAAQLTERYAVLIKKYTDLNNAFFGVAGGRRRRRATASKKRNRRRTQRKH